MSLSADHGRAVQQVRDDLAAMVGRIRGIQRTVPVGDALWRELAELRIDAASCRVVACAVRARLLPLVMPDVLRHLHDRAKKGYFSGSVVVEDDGECPVSLVLEAVAMELLKLGFLVRTEIFETDRRHYREQRPGLEVDWGGQAS